MLVWNFLFCSRKQQDVNILWIQGCVVKGSFSEEAKSIKCKLLFSLILKFPRCKIEIAIPFQSHKELLDQKPIMGGKGIVAKLEKVSLLQSVMVKVKKSNTCPNSRVDLYLLGEAVPHFPFHGKGFSLSSKVLCFPSMVQSTVGK